MHLKAVETRREKNLARMILDQTNQFQNCLTETDIIIKYNNKYGHYTKITTMTPWNTNIDLMIGREESILDLTLKLNS